MGGRAEDVPSAGGGAREWPPGPPVAQCPGQCVAGPCPRGGQGIPSGRRQQAPGMAVTVER